MLQKRSHLCARQDVALQVPLHQRPINREQLHPPLRSEEMRDEMYRALAVRRADLHCPEGWVMRQI